MSQGETMRLGFGSNKPDLTQSIELIRETFTNTKFTHFDFRRILDRITVREP